MVRVLADATYIHHLNPILVELGPLKLRWYGLAYVAGFAAVMLLMRSFARRGMSRLPEDKVVDFVTYAAIFGVMLGGRLGYALFYSPDLLFGARPEFPWWNFLAINEGGMASHGGVLGLMAFTLWYSWKHKIPWTNLGDNLVVGATLGIFFGRLANFINGELYGHVARGISWAVRFPQEMVRDTRHPGLSLDDSTRAELVENAINLHPDLHDTGEGDIYHAIIARMREDEATREALGRFLQPRHPSQLYEALLEGLLLFAILYAVRVRWPKLRDGILTGLFFVCYAVFRIIAEQFRVPDSEMIGPLTKGQFYSVFMILIGAAFLVHSFRRPDPNPPTA